MSSTNGHPRGLRALLVASALALALGARAAEPEDAASAGAASAEAKSRRVLRAPLSGVINAGTADYITQAIKQAEQGEYSALLIVLDTPGGVLDATRALVRAILAAQVPVIVYVAPAGAHAGSAGVFVTLAANIAAMAPGTNIGAAHPVTGGGEDVEKQAGKEMAKKVENDTAAFARSIAEQRGRNVEWAEKAVRESVAVTDREAVKNNVVDLVAPTEEELLSAIDGRKVNLPNKRVVTLATARARLDTFAMTIQQRALAVLGDPNVAYILVMLGMLGVMMELYHPGTIIPGALGAFFLLLAGIGFNLLPVNIGGVVLLVVAAALFVAEFYVTSFGILTIGGAVCLVLGSLLLMDSARPDFFIEPSVRLGWGVVIPVVAAVTAIAITIMTLVVRAYRRRQATGHEGMIGERGTVRIDVTPEGGRVFVHGELWHAVSDETIPAGTSVEVVGLDGLHLKVVRRDRVS